MEITKLYEIVGKYVIYLSAGMAIATLFFWLIGKFITYVIKSIGAWNTFVDMAFNYKQYKKWKNDTKTKSN